jgi:hypothetical protein
MKLKQVQHFSDIISSQLLQCVRSCSLCGCQYLWLYSINSRMTGERWFERIWKEVTVVWSELQFLSLPEKTYRKPHSGQLMPQLLNYENYLLNYCCTNLLGRRHKEVYELNTKTSTGAGIYCKFTVILGCDAIHFSRHISVEAAAFIF